MIGLLKVCFFMEAKGQIPKDISGAGLIRIRFVYFLRDRRRAIAQRLLDIWSEASAFEFLLVSHQSFDSLEPFNVSLLASVIKCCVRKSNETLLGI